VLAKSVLRSVWLVLGLLTVNRSFQEDRSQKWRSG